VHSRNSGRTTKLVYARWAPRPPSGRRAARGRSQSVVCCAMTAGAAPRLLLSVSKLLKFFKLLGQHLYPKIKKTTIIKLSVVTHTPTHKSRAYAANVAEPTIIVESKTQFGLTEQY
jgi:hypothetical protein